MFLDSRFCAVVGYWRSQWFFDVTGIARFKHQTSRFPSLLKALKLSFFGLCLLKKRSNGMLVSSWKSKRLLGENTSVLRVPSRLSSPASPCSPWPSLAHSSAVGGANSGVGDRVPGCGGWTFYFDF